MSAKRARLSGEFQSRAGYPQNGPAAGSGYVLRSGDKVKARNQRQNRNIGIGFGKKIRVNLST
jgi:hypothetical protein